MSTRISPNHREALTAVSSISGQDEYLFSTNHALNISATITPSGTQDVNITKVAGAAISQGHGTAASAIRVELPTDGTGAVGLNAGTNVIGHVITDSGSTTAITGTVTVSGTVAATQSGAWSVGSSTATGSAIPANAFYMGINGGGNLTGPAGAADNADAVAVTSTANRMYAIARNTVFNGTTWDRASGTTLGAYGIIRDAAGNARGVNVTAGNALTVDASATTQPVSYATTGSGTATGALRVELPTNGTGVIATIGAVTAITNALPVGANAIGKLAANSGVDIGDIDVTSVIAGTGATNLGKAEDAGHTTGDTGVFTLGVRNDTLADVTNTTADYSQMSTDLKGRVMTAGAPRALKGMAQVSVSNTTTETTIIAATASTFHDVYGIILANTGASTTKVSIRDDTAGTVRAIIEVPTLETRGFMLPVDSAIPQTAVNKNWTVQCGTATTALEVTSLYVSMV